MIRLIKDELVGKIIRELAAFRPKPYFYLMDDSNSEGTQNM